MVILPSIRPVGTVAAAPGQASNSTVTADLTDFIAPNDTPDHRTNLDREAPRTYPVGMEEDAVLIFGKDT
jgi:hypothetical protein